MEEPRTILATMLSVASSELLLTSFKSESSARRWQPPILSSTTNRNTQDTSSSLCSPFSSSPSPVLISSKPDTAPSICTEEPAPLPFIRSQIIGSNASFVSSFGSRLVTYADYTASGRSLHFIEQQILALLPMYANTHTEDSITGQHMTSLLHQAESMIKACLNAGPNGRLVLSQSTGATGAINKLQQIIGVYIPPATKLNLGANLQQQVHLQPVVFVGPYEHHSNEVSWRQGLCTVVEVELNKTTGGIDMDHLAALLRDDQYNQPPGRLRIVSMSAASNVTGMISPVHEIARLAHTHNALCFFDYAASAPYVKIDMNPIGDALGALDAVFISPHKFLGGPGASGVLCFNEKIYHRELSPTVGGGGTVTYVSTKDEDFVADVEEREKAGTPGILQALRAALAMDFTASLVGYERIHHLEQNMLRRAFAKWTQPGSQVEILGNLDPSKRVGIVSFNVKDPRGKYLHFRLVATLLNDLFGIQSRAGCSCAGPYGHRLLNIDDFTSAKYRGQVRLGLYGIKPGWCRVGFHWSMDDDEVDFIINAVCFVAEFGARFIPMYEFDKNSGRWTARRQDDEAEEVPLVVLSASAALRKFGGAARCNAAEEAVLTPAQRKCKYDEYLEQARRIAEHLPEPSPIYGACAPPVTKTAFHELMFFNLF
jgi:selenocysteine lyase/cysteine desulfurase